MYFKCIFMFVNTRPRETTPLNTMQLTKHTDYAFKVLIYLANMQEEKVTIKQLTERFSLSQAHLMKVVNVLSQAGWVTTLRGKNGGMFLGVAPHELTLRAVVERMEKTLIPFDCEKPPCFFNGACQLKGLLFAAQEQYLAHLERHTLADLIRPDTQQRIVVLRDDQGG